MSIAAQSVRAIEQSFDEILKQKDEFASRFYVNLFRLEPQLQPLFAKTNMDEQKKMLISALTLVVRNLEKPAMLASTLRGLGARHVRYGVKEENLYLFEKALLATFADSNVSNWTIATERAWSEAYAIVMQLLAEGLREGAS
ncbi:globin domain-containing protein [Pseudanabaena sp. PCC 6802]|uniref:globin domain-containing protein n=1 Tax=Pseudanabaena sp. PCC 6802 TaxID=118173 RepID=UPI000348BDA0|nr:globin domain-containing protein [Pseudanabaena sp. PCC 6802]